MFFALYENVNPLNKSTAVVEILLLLLGSFVLGYIAHWLLCRYRHHSASTKRPVQIVERRPVSTPLAQPAKKDDLKMIEGIGPKIEELLHESGISTFADLANTSQQNLDRVLEQAGSRFQMHNTTSWARQAALAREGRWKELERLKEILVAGR